MREFVAQLELRRSNLLQEDLDEAQQEVLLREMNELVTHIETLEDDVDEYDNVYRYRDDPVGFVRNECWIFNPEKTPSVIPFSLYDYQERLLREVHEAYVNEESVLTEKSRQMGLSWLFMAFMLWGIKYDPHFTGFCMSYKADLVDDGGESSTMDSLFGKLRFMYNNLREGIRKDLVFKHMVIRNDRTHTYLVGDTANVDAGRGGTYRIGLWDETASTPRSEQIFSAFHQACRCRCYNSTPKGKANVFARLRFDPGATTKKITLHWTQHPDKGKDAVQKPDGKWTSPWYEYQVRDMTPAQIASELDVDYETSLEGRVYPKLSRSVHVKDDLVFNEAWETILAFDLGIADETFGLVMQKDPLGNIQVIDEVLGTDEDIRFYIQLVLGIRPPELAYFYGDAKAMYERFLTNAVKRHYANFVHVAGHDAAQRSIANKTSVKQQFLTAANLGRDNGRMDRRYRNIRMVTLGGYKITYGVELVKKLLDPQKQRLFISDVCVHLIERLMNYQWTITQTGVNREVPLHNWCSHGADALRYGVVYLERHRRVMGKPEPMRDRSSGISPTVRLSHGARRVRR